MKTVRNKVSYSVIVAEADLRGGSECVIECLSGVTEVDLTSVTIQLWQLSKQQEGQVMTQQTALA